MAWGKTVRRDKLFRAAEKGHLWVKCSGRYTDDYAFDAATNFGKMDTYKQVKIYPEGEPIEYDGETIGMKRWHFTGTKTGYAYCYEGKTDEGTLAVHSNLTYEWKILVPKAA